MFFFVFLFSPSRKKLSTLLAEANRCRKAGTLNTLNFLDLGNGCAPDAIPDAIFPGNLIYLIQFDLDHEITTLFSQQEIASWLGCWCMVPRAHVLGLI